MVPPLVSMARKIEQEMAMDTPLLSTIHRFIPTASCQHDNLEGKCHRCVLATILPFFGSTSSCQNGKDSQQEVATVAVFSAADFLILSCTSCQHGKDNQQKVATGAPSVSTDTRFLNHTASCQHGKDNSAENGHGFVFQRLFNS